MKKLLAVGVALGLLLFSKVASPGPLRFALLATAVALSASVLVYGVRERRRRGQSWNDALAGNTKLITGNVWLDGVLFAGVLLVCGITVVLVMIYV